MSDLEKRVDAISRFILADDTEGREKARARLRKLMNNAPTAAGLEVDAESITREIFLELGAPDHLMGHDYAIAGILMVVENRMYTDNITFGLYPQLAAKFDTTASRVERAIRHVVEVMWTRGDPDVLFRYFGNTVDANKGKPTNGEFIARISNIVKLRLRNAA